MRQDQEEKQTIETGTGAVRSMCEKQQQQNKNSVINMFIRIDDKIQDFTRELESIK